MKQASNNVGQLLTNQLHDINWDTRGVCVCNNNANDTYVCMCECNICYTDVYCRCTCDPMNRIIINKLSERIAQ